jgi:hypothetical protein
MSKRQINNCNVRWIILSVAVLLFHPGVAKISYYSSSYNFGLFKIVFEHKASFNWQTVASLRVFKGEELVIEDSCLTDLGACEGFSFPANQPFKDYFIFSKHFPKEGKTFILTAKGDFKVISGGSFWAAPKHQLLFILAEKDYRTLVIFSIKEMKTIFEKFSCDEFIDWYFRKGAYFGRVSTECGTELKPEKEVSEWMHPVEIEQFDVKRRALNEMHLTDEQVEHSQPLVKYASCK